MRILKQFGLVALFVVLLVASPFGSMVRVRAQAIDDSVLQILYDKFVMPDKLIEEFTLNVVDYQSIWEERKKKGSLYSKILAQFSEAKPELIQNREDQIAFWINAYNVGAIKMILDHYPVDSIRSRKINFFKLPWGKKILDVGGKMYSLSEIEHDILLGKFKEPMIHFAIVCASLSCPEINTKVYRGTTLMEQLEIQATDFLNDPQKGLRIDRKSGVVHFSQIFKFDKKTFPQGAKDAVGLIKRFVSEEDAKYLASGNYQIKHLDYDWSLNSFSRVN